MEDSQNEIKSIKVIKLNNKKEDWDEFAQKFKAIPDEKGYVGILNGSETVRAEKATVAANDKGREMSRLMKVNKRWYRHLIFTAKMSLAIVGNAKSNDLPSGDLQLAWKKLEKRQDPKSREDKADLLMKVLTLRMEHANIKPQD